jgi:hypothetical protein
MINNKDLVNETKNVLLKEIDTMFKDCDANLMEIFKIAIDNAINKTAHDVNYDIINKGEFVGFGGKK